MLCKSVSCSVKAIQLYWSCLHMSCHVMSCRAMLMLTDCASETLFATVPLSEALLMICKPLCLCKVLCCIRDCVA